MTFRIHRGKHRARPFRFGLWWRKKSFSWVVKFTESCRYDLQNEDQGDTNKLIGIGYLPGHHKDSARFGWRYDAVTGNVELSAYCYVGGQREIKHVCFCEIEKWYYIELTSLEKWYQFFVFRHGELKHFGSAAVQHYHRKKFKYRLGTFFGGQARAPHDIKMEVKRSG
jgi:hypothetical protein